MESRRPPNVQDSFLFQTLKDKRLVFVTMVDGSCLFGTIERFDRFVIVVNQDGKTDDQVLVYKSAVCRLSASSPKE